MNATPQSHHKRLPRSSLSSLPLLHLTLVNGEHQGPIPQPCRFKEEIISSL